MVTAKKALVGVLVVLWACASLGCAVRYGRAQDAYRDGRYLEAAESLARREAEVQTAPESQQALYGTYRGLALMQLGDYEGARRWMQFALDAEKRQPTLGLDVRRQLDAGWSELQNNKP